MSCCDGCADGEAWPPQCTVRLVDGTQECGSVLDWAKLPADHISQITVGTKAIAGHQFYYCYPDEPTPGEEAWVLGGVSVYEHWATEHLIRKDEILSRRTKFVPDLQHEQVKLGWWWVD